MTITVSPIGYVRGGRSAILEEGWGDVRAAIELDAERFTSEALLGLDDFSHVEVVFAFHRASSSAMVSTSRHPHGRLDWPRVGIFAQRGKDRPNQLGVTICRVISVDGRRLEVEGLDAIEGTPVLDLKPYMSGYGPRGPVREPLWAREALKNYW